MDLTQFLEKYSKVIRFSEEEFLTRVWWPVWGEWGLKKTYPQVMFTSEAIDYQTNYYIDFVVVTRNKDFVAKDCVVVNSIEEGLIIAKQNGDEEAFVIGGGQIYGKSLTEDLIDKLYITYVHESFEADVFFPDYDKSKWNKTSEIFHPKDEKHEFSFSYVTYEK